MPLVDHLTELRARVIWSAIALTVGAVVAFALYNRILDFLIQPYTEITGKRELVILDPLEGFAARLKVSVWCGAFLGSPVVLWQLWRFVTPGLHKHEKRFAVPFIVASILLFALGAALALFTFPQALRFLVAVGGPNIDPLFSPGKYLGLITLMMVAFGIAFEFPILLVFLQLAGVVTSRRLRGWRRPAVVIVVAVAAVLTPSQDPYSLLAMAAPMYLFYELAILVGRLLKK
jgi:sec-independent protein translocase protein TatC